MQLFSFRSHFLSALSLALSLSLSLSLCLSLSSLFPLHAVTRLVFFSFASSSHRDCINHPPPCYSASFFARYSLSRSFLLPHLRRNNSIVFFYPLYFHSSLFHLPFGSCPFFPRPRRKEGPLESRSPRNSSFLAFRSTYDRVVRLFIAPRPTKRRRNSLSVAEHRRRVILLFRSRRMHRFCCGCRHVAMPTRPRPKVILFSLLYRFVNACATLSGNEVRVESNLTRRQRVSRGQRVSPLSNSLSVRV